MEKKSARVSKESRLRTYLLYPTNCLRRHIDSGVELFLVNEEHGGDEERIKFHFRGDLMTANHHSTEETERNANVALSESLHTHRHIFRFIHVHLFCCAPCTFPCAPFHPFGNTVRSRMRAFLYSYSHTYMCVYVVLESLHTCPPLPVFASLTSPICTSS